MLLPHCHVSLSPFRTGGSHVPSSPNRWYKRSEAQKRFTFFFGSTSLGGAFGGLLAYAISKLDGTAGLASWRWVFIVGAFPFPFQLSCIEFVP